MSDDSKKNKRIVSSLLMASAMAVPSVALDQKAVDEIAMKAAGKRTSEVKILDSQSTHEKLNRVIAPNWGRVWGKITWARIIEEM